MGDRTRKRNNTRDNFLSPRPTCRQGKLLITCHLFFFSAFKLPSPSSKPQAPVPFLSSTRHIGLNYAACPLWGSSIYKIKCVFCSLVNLSYASLIIRPTKEPTREGETFPPLHGDPLPEVSWPGLCRTLAGDTAS